MTGAPIDRRPARVSRRTSKKISVMLVDDHPIWRTTLRGLLEDTCTIVAEASDGAEAVEVSRQTEPEVVVMDIHLPGMSGIEATRALLADRPGVKVLMLSSSDEKAQVVEAVKAGASGYLVKTLGPEEIADAVMRVERGELVFPPALADLVLEEFRRMAVEGPEPAAIRLVVADGSVVSREGRAHVLSQAGFEVSGQVGSPPELIELLSQECPHVAVLDARVAFARPDGKTTVVAMIRKRFPSVGILVLAAEDDAAEAVGLISEGEQGLGYVLQERIGDIEELAGIVRRVARGESVIDPRIVNRLVSSPRPREALARLTEREREVLALMAEGRSNIAIAEQLFLGSKTVEAHVGSIFSKLGLGNAPDDHRRVLAVVAYLRSLS